MCPVQEWLSYFWSYLPLFCLKRISRLLCNWNTLQNILMVPGRTVSSKYSKGIQVTEWTRSFTLTPAPMLTRRRVPNKNDNSAFLTFVIISLCYI